MIALGTSSWLFDAWRGPFYPADLGRKGYLAHYALQFRTVEVNTSFYGQPRDSTVQNWRMSVPEGFTFCLKFPRVISHEKRLVGCEAESEAFLALLRSMGEAAAPAFLQLPPSLSRATAGRALADYLAWLAELGSDLRLAVEVRAPDLMTPAFLRYVMELGLAPVIVDRVNTPDLFPAWLALTEEGVGPSHAIVRWIGDDKNGPTGDRELSAPRDGELDRWADRLASVSALGLDLFGYMHNPYEGHSPASVRRLEARLQERMPLTEWHPEPPAPAPAASQLSLFDDR